ncbi:hypothetical protein Anamo_0369 [Acetomicrobium mobile DSM 13181]|uniref:Uncharacterized protein n=2 Tax=Acetomicrobium TaxID=49894 RepID=I4BUR9_ACEMN|nr:hypothetical protein Anamo_0369 [Acetomicrobium mobile DSM 13181]SIN65286.1 hypothetical protein SAMN05444368_0740 [Acetomicrobium flavidum]
MSLRLTEYILLNLAFPLIMLYRWYPYPLFGKGIFKGQREEVLMICDLTN